MLAKPHLVNHDSAYHTFTTMSKYHIKEHKFPTSYVREYPRALADDQEDELHIAIKQYTPLDNTSPKAGDITIIAAHANGFPKVRASIVYMLSSR